MSGADVGNERGRGGEGEGGGRRRRWRGASAQLMRRYNAMADRDAPARASYRSPLAPLLLEVARSS